MASLTPLENPLFAARMGPCPTVDEGQVVQRRAAKLADLRQHVHAECVVRVTADLRKKPHKEPLPCRSIRVCN